MKRTMTILMLAASLLSAQHVDADDATDANLPPAILSAICGGGAVRRTVNGFTVRMPDGQSVHWNRSFNGYSASLNGKPVSVMRTYNGFKVSGENARHVSLTHRGFTVHNGTGSSTWWAETHDGYSATVNGRRVSLYRTFDGYGSSTAPAHRPLTIQRKPRPVKRMSLSQPSSFRQWPPATNRFQYCRFQ